MAKRPTLSDLVSLTNETSVVNTINNNNDEIKTAFDNTLSRDGSTPNTMEADLDMNSNHILNVGDPTQNSHVMTKGYADANYGDASAQATAAAASATAAAASATAAASSATSASNSAASLSGTSTDSRAIGTGSKSFTTQSGKFFNAGTYLLITSDADPTNYMTGQVTSYSGTALTVDVDATGGSGTYADWTIRVAGAVGADGAAGPAGSLDIAAAGGTADAITADYTPDVALVDKTLVVVIAGAANATTTPTFSPDGLTAKTIKKKGNQALVAGDISGAGHVCILEYNSSNDVWELLNPAKIVTADILDAQVTEAKLLLADNTTNNVSTTKHGLAPKLPNDATKFLDGTGNYTTPAAASGAWVLLDTQTASASANLTFTGLTSSYSKFMFVLQDIKPATDGVYLYVYTSADGGSTWDTGASDYGWDTNNQAAFDGADRAYGYVYTGSTLGNGANEGISGELTAFNLPSTTTWKFFKPQVVGINTAGNPYIGNSWFSRQTNSAINALKFQMSSGNITSGKIYCYALSNT